MMNNTSSISVLLAALVLCRIDAFSVERSAARHRITSSSTSSISSSYSAYGDESWMYNNNDQYENEDEYRYGETRPYIDNSEPVVKVFEPFFTAASKFIDPWVPSHSAAEVESSFESSKPKEFVDAVIVESTHTQRATPLTRAGDSAPPPPTLEQQEEERTVIYEEAYSEPSSFRHGCDYTYGDYEDPYAYEYEYEYEVRRPEPAANGNANARQHSAFGFGGAPQVPFGAAAWEAYETTDRSVPFEVFRNEYMNYLMQEMD